VLATIWAQSAEWSAQLGYAESEIAPALLFIYVYMVYNTIAGLPWKYYSNFVIEGVSLCLCVRVLSSRATRFQQNDDSFDDQ
jgi:hypothetical protein